MNKRILFYTSVSGAAEITEVITQSLIEYSFMGFAVNFEELKFLFRQIQIDRIVIDKRCCTEDQMYLVDSLPLEMQQKIMFMVFDQEPAGMMERKGRKYGVLSVGDVSDDRNRV